MAAEPNHSYEELRAAALSVFSRRDRGELRISQYHEFEAAVGDELARVEKRTESGNFGGHYPLSPADSELFRELFWDLFRQGIVTLGSNRSNPEFPYFRLSRLGERMVSGEQSYFFLDVSDYERVIRKEIPLIDEATLVYLKEAMQAFRSGCLLSSAVMLGVATEHSFLLLVEYLERNPDTSATYAAVFKERTILRKLAKFKGILDQQKNDLPSATKENLDTYFMTISDVFRVFRNESGHPTGKFVEREQVFILLHLFPPYCKKLYQLIEYFREKS